MYNIFKNIVCLLMINLIACMGYLVPYISTLYIIAIMGDKISIKFIYCLMIISIFIILGRLFVLPIAYKKIENFENFKLLSEFIKKVRNSFYLKIIVLIIVYLFDRFICFISFNTEPAFRISHNVLVNLSGCYIVLFVYWYIEDKIKNYSNSKSN